MLSFYRRDSEEGSCRDQGSNDMPFTVFDSRSIKEGKMNPPSYPKERIHKIWKKCDDASDLPQKSQC